MPGAVEADTTTVFSKPAIYESELVDLSSRGPAVPSQRWSTHAFRGASEGIISLEIAMIVDDGRLMIRGQKGREGRKASILTTVHSTPTGASYGKALAGCCRAEVSTLSSTWSATETEWSAERICWRPLGGRIVRRSWPGRDASMWPAPRSVTTAFNSGIRPHDPRKGFNRRRCARGKARRESQNRLMLRFLHRSASRERRQLTIMVCSSTGWPTLRGMGPEFLRDAHGRPPWCASTGRGRSQGLRGEHTPDGTTPISGLSGSRRERRESRRGRTFHGFGAIAGLNVEHAGGELQASVSLATGNL